MKKIVVALDGSELAERAVPIAATLASQVKGEVVLASIIVDADRWSRGELLADGMDEERGLAEFYLGQIKDRFRESRAKVEIRVEYGRAAETLAAMADDQAADLTVITTHGRSGVARWVLGSVADKLLHLSRVPVLLVRADSEPPAVERPFKRILVPLDGSSTAESALPFTERLAADLGATLILEGVIVPTAALYAGTFVPSTPPALQEIEAGSREYLGQVAEKVSKRGLQVTTRVDVGYAAETILEAASETGADLIALCSHGRSGPERWIRGSVADTLIRHADLPCLVVPALKARSSTASDEHTEMLGASVPIAGNTVVPPPTLQETVVIGRETKARAPEVRPHRPERSPGRAR